MPVTARTIGSGTAGAGKTTTITVTSAPLGSEVVLACGAAVIGPTAFGDTTGITSASDTALGGWIVVGGGAGNGPLIGNGQSIWGTNPNVFTMNIDSVERTSGNPLIAGTVVTLNWDPVPTPDPSESLAFLVAIDGVQDHYVTQDGFGLYFNSDQNPENGGASNVLDWAADLGPLTHADDAAAFLGLYGSYDGSGVSPVTGAVFKELTNTHLYLAAAFATAVGAGSTVDPSATFVGGDACVGNYQLIGLTSTPGPTPKATCTKCGSGLMGLSYRQ